MSKAEEWRDKLAAMATDEEDCTENPFEEMSDESENYVIDERDKATYALFTDKSTIRIRPIGNFGFIFEAKNLSDVEYLRTQEIFAKIGFKESSNTSGGSNNVH